jgi:hypothetical protein
MDVVAFLEARFRKPFEKRQKKIVPLAEKIGVHIVFSSGARYGREKTWFFKISERALLANDHVVIWSDWTQTGWMIPTNRLHGFLITMPQTASNGPKRWDPRIRIGALGGELWLNERRGILDVSDCEIRFSETSELYDTFPKQTAVEFMELDATRSVQAPSAEHEEALLIRAARDMRNTRLGLLGELAIIDFERRRLSQIGLSDLAGKVRHVSQEPGGDARGFDILSFDAKRKDVMIEVKTTMGSARTPFFISRNELNTSERNGDQWRLARIYDFGEKPKSFIVKPPLEESFGLSPKLYSATPIFAM